MNSIISAIVTMIAVPLLILTPFVGIGTLLYHWGPLELTFAASAWIAFKVWGTMLVTGLVALFTGMLLTA